MELRDQDRPFLRNLCERVQAVSLARRSLSTKPEAVWSASVATFDRELALEVFTSSDTSDAVVRLLKSFRPVDYSQEEVTLYLSLEPRAGFGRLPPVTESIRRLGVKRVVIGALDPAQRLRGEGVETLRRMGIEVVLADGEEARLCQQVVEDLTKWHGRGLTVLKASAELKRSQGEVLDFCLASNGALAEAVICLAGQKTKVKSNQWLVVLDADGLERPGEGVIVYQNRLKHVVAGARGIEFEGGYPNLGALLRDLAALGIVSAELCEDAFLFRLALKAGLLDSVVADLSEAPSLAAVGKVSLTQGGEQWTLRLDGARLLSDRRLEARVALSN